MKHNMGYMYIYIFKYWFDFWYNIKHQKPCIEAYLRKKNRVVEKKQLNVLFFQIIIDIASKSRYYVSIVVW